MIELNKKQKIAVEHIESPLIVSAYPGSGKTRIITEKSKYLLSLGIREQDILILTFSNKAVNEIIARLSDDIGFLNSINVFTFHSFSQNILMEFGSYIGIRNNFSVMDDMESFVFLKNHFFDFDIDKLRPISNPYKNIPDILRFFSKMQDEYIKGKEFLKNENNDIQKELSYLYNEFYNLKINENKLQFNDLIYLVIELFEKEKAVLDTIKGRYKYILIDEFQDTNYIQNLLLAQISDGVHITVVGDRNQSIYRFRGASLNNFNTFKKEFRGVLEIDLDINYRSYQDVLDHSFKFMELDPIKSIKGYKRESIEILHFEKQKDEIYYILNKIKKLHEDGVEYFDIAIIARTNAIISDFADIANSLGIPFYLKGNNNFTISQVVKDLTALIYFLNNNDDNISFMRLISSGVFGISQNDIFTLLSGASFSKISYFKYMKLVSDGKIDAKISDMNKINMTVNLIENILSFDSKNMKDVVIQFLDSVNYYSYVETLKDSSIQKENLDRFLKIIDKFNELEIGSFVEYLPYLDKVSFDDTEDMEDSIDGVVLSTVHGVKGGEYKYVFMPYLAEGFFPTYDRSKTFEVPSNLVKEEIEKDSAYMDEEKRLFFVGMTRAKEYLCMSYSSSYKGHKKEQKISPFLQNVLDVSGYKVENIKDIDIEDIDVHPQFFIPSTFKIKSYSFSQISMFERCPLQYYYNYVLHVPMNPNYSFFYGTIIHNTLRRFLSLDKENWNKENIHKIYLDIWESGDKSVFLGEKHEKLYKENGLVSLEKSLDIIQPKTDKFLVEKDVEYMFKNKYLIKGRVDRVDIFKNNSANIIDYKTGKKSTDLRDYKFQLWLYSLAISNTYRLEIKDLSLIFIDDKDKVDIKMENIKFKDMENRLLHTLSLMDNMEIKATPSFMCNFCDYRLLCYKR